MPAGTAHVSKPLHCHHNVPAGVSISPEYSGFISRQIHSCSHQKTKSLSVFYQNPTWFLSQKSCCSWIAKFVSQNWSRNKLSTCEGSVLHGGGLSGKINEPISSAKTDRLEVLKKKWLLHSCLFGTLAHTFTLRWRITRHQPTSNCTRPKRTCSGWWVWWYVTSGWRLAAVFILVLSVGGPMTLFVRDPPHW